MKRPINLSCFIAWTTIKTRACNLQRSNLKKNWILRYESGALTSLCQFNVNYDVLSCLSSSGFLVYLKLTLHTCFGAIFHALKDWLLTKAKIIQKINHFAVKSCGFVTQIRIIQILKIRNNDSGWVFDNIRYHNITNFHCESLGVLWMLDVSNCCKNVVQIEINDFV